MDLITLALATASPDEAGPGMSFTVENLLRFAGRLHPATVHFPVALILTAVAFETIAAIRDGQRRSRLALQCLGIGAVFAALAAWFGWISAEHEFGTSGDQTLFIHRWSGVAAAGLALLALLMAALVRDGRPLWAMRAYRGGLLLSGACIALGGYLGGELVHGSGHLLEAFRPEAERPVRVAPAPQRPSDAGSGAELVTFERDVRPIFEAHCVHCHGERRQRGRLRLDELDYVFEGAQEGWVIQPGDADASELVVRIELEEGHDDLMPADDVPLAEAQVTLIRTWIDRGAPRGDAIPAVTETGGGDRSDGGNDAPPVDPSQVVGPPDELGIALTPAQRQARDAVVERVRARGGVAAPVSAGSNAVDINLSLADPPFGDADVALLEGLEASLVWLDLSRSALTDEGLAALAAFTRLQRLRLDNTAVTDAGTEHLASLVALRSLNLYGTSVTDEGAARLAALPALERVYLWNTAVTDAGGEALRAARPGLAVDLGAPLPPVPEPVEGELVSFATQILPIFEERCVGCHGERRMRGDLRLDTHELVVRGSASGPVIEAGNPEGSTLAQRIALPADHDDIMPADGDPLAEEQIALIRTWIEQGAEAN